MGNLSLIREGVGLLKTLSGKSSTYPQQKFIWILFVV